MNSPLQPTRTSSSQIHYFDIYLSTIPYRYEDWMMIQNESYCEQVLRELYFSLHSFLFPNTLGLECTHYNQREKWAGFDIRWKHTIICPRTIRV